MTSHVHSSKHLLIVNPAAGGGTAEASIPMIEKTLGNYGVSFELVRTEAPLHAISLAREAVRDGFDVVVAVGGDGTANEVLNGLVEAKLANEGEAALGVLCVGRGNDFAYGAGIPHALGDGCRALAEGNRSTIDIGRVEGGLYPDGRYFGNGVGIGFDAVVGFEAKKLKRFRGFAGYLIAALRTIFLYFRAPTVRLEHDEGSRELPALMVSVMNGRRMGGGFLMAPEARMGDGAFDLCVARQVGRLAIFRLIGRFLKGTQAGHPAIWFGRTKRIVVEAMDGVLPAHADGETLCTDAEWLVLELLPRQLDVVCGGRT